MVDISSSNCYLKAKGWASFYKDRMQAFVDLHLVDRSYVDLMEDWYLLIVLNIWLL